MKGADFTRAALHRRCWRDDDIAALLGAADWRGPCPVTRRTLEWFDAARVLEAESAEPVFAKRRAARSEGLHWQAIKRTPAMLTAPQLMRRGWRAFDIRRHLGEAESYALNRVEAAEQSDPVLRAAVARNQPWGLR